MSHEIKEERSSTVGDSTSAYGAAVKITISYMDEPEKVSILQFGKDNELLSKTDHAPKALPDTLKVQPGTQYIIVETTSVSRERVKTITRTLYQPEDDYLYAFFGRDDGICVKLGCEIDWNK